MLEIKNSATEMKDASDRLISRLDTAENRISQLKGNLKQSSTAKSKKNKTWKKIEYSRTTGQLWETSCAYDRDIKGE